MIEVRAEIAASVWKLLVAPGATVGRGQQLAILESMKMEMPVESEVAGVVKEIRCQEGQAVSEGETLVVVE